jgi:hypothetical protein
MEAVQKSKMTVCALVRMILLIIVLLAGLFWTWFGVASGIAEGLNNWGTLFHSLMPGVLLLLAAFLAIRWPAMGGILLIAVGVYYYFFFHVHDWRVFAALVAPPVIAGLWALVSELLCKQKRPVTKHAE